MRKITQTALRKKYPHPVRAMGSKMGAYCVGGALCQEVGIDALFPNGSELREAFFKARPDVDRADISDREHEYMMRKFSEVTAYNDVGNFHVAWRCLGELLRWTPRALVRRRVNRQTERK